jgi:hypothetical protein
VHCAAVKEFLDKNLVPYVPINVQEDRDAWLKLGSPPVPAVVIDGVAHSITHPLEVASMFGLPVPPTQEAESIGWDLDRVLRAWIDCARTTPWEAWLEPTPSRGRSSLHLGLNSFVPIPVLAESWVTGIFPWGTPEWPPPHGSSANQAALNERCRELDAFLEFVEPIRYDWSSFLGDRSPELRDAGARDIEMARGRSISYSRLLEMQRLHAAQHYRQVSVHLSSAGYAIPSFAPEQLQIDLPDRVY